MTFEARRIGQGSKKILSPEQQPNQATYVLARLIRGGRPSLFPGIISANIPEVALGVATAKAPPAIVLVFDLDDDLGPSSNSAVIDRIGVGDDQVRTLRGPAKRGRSGLRLAEPIVAQRTQHNHSVAERQLGVHDAIAP